MEAVSRPRSATTKTLAAIGPNFTLAVFFVLGLFVVVLTYGGHIKWKEGPILISVGIMTGILVLRAIWGVPALLRGAPGAGASLRHAMLRTVYDWGPLIIVVWMFESLGAYTGVIRSAVYDQAMYDADVWLVGIEPSVWTGRHMFHPLLVDWFSITYGLYFITPMVLATILSLRGRRGDFTEMVSAVVIQMGIGFLLHLFVPVGPPRHFPPLFNGGFTPPRLHSFTGLMELQQGAFDTAHPLTTRASFPSLHCSLGMMTLLYANRYSSAVFPKSPRLFFRIVIVLVVSLWFSTIYLRHHWLPDIAAGLVLGAFSVWLATRMRKVWPAPATTVVTG